MIKLNVTTVTDFLLMAVQERGFDYTYERPDEFVGCLYVHDTEKEVDGEIVDAPEEEWTPGCIVGFVLNKAGVTLAQLKQYEHNHAASVIAKLQSDGILEIDEASISLLRAVQVKQDDRQDWGRAVITALGDRLRNAQDDVDRMKKTSEDRFKALREIRDLTYGI
jgi:hypothetical protein